MLFTTSSFSTYVIYLIFKKQLKYHNNIHKHHNMPILMINVALLSNCYIQQINQHPYEIHVASAVYN